MGAFDDDVELGNTEIGEASRGMQDAELLGAAAKLSGALGERFNRYAPLVKRLRSPYKDSTQVGLSVVSSALAAAGFPSAGVTISGQTRVEISFKPNKLMISESVAAVWTLSNNTTVTVFATPATATDILIVGAFAGNKNCFPTAPTAGSGTLAAHYPPNGLGNGISWPTINEGIAWTMQYLIRPTVLAQTASPAAGATLTNVTVTVDATIFGPQLR